MAKTLRVHHLAKELGVASKEIVAKCNAEGVQPQLKNHMAAVSLGLAESIREWFSTGADVTTIEVATPVNLKKVKKPRAHKSSQLEGETVATDEESQVADATEVSVAVSSEPATGELAQEPGITPAAAAGIEEPPTEKTVEELPPALTEEVAELSQGEIAATEAASQEATEVDVTVEGATDTAVLTPPAEAMEEPEEEERQLPPPSPPGTDQTSRTANRTQGSGSERSARH